MTNFCTKALIILYQLYTSSTWTIDLCYLLKRLGMRHEFWTTVLGVNQGYGSDKFYRDILDKDRIRVNNRFKAAPANGITARKGLLRMDEILLHLSNHGPIILLTNGELLSCKKLTNELRQDAIINISGLDYDIVSFPFLGTSFPWTRSTVVTTSCSVALVRALARFYTEILRRATKYVPFHLNNSILLGALLALITT